MRVLVFLAIASAVLGAAPQDGPKPSLNVGGLDAPGGTIKGIVKFTGPKPEIVPITGILGNAFCKEQCKDGKPPLEEKFVFGRNGSDDTLQNVLVWVSKGLEGRTFEAPKARVVMDQVACVYTPHVVSVMVGQTLEIRNSDATLHNVMTTPFKNRPFNEGMPVKGGILEKTFAVPEMKVGLRCFMHPWMLGWVHVLEHPFHAVTQADGTFMIRGLPPGEYEVSVLHETSRLQPTANGVKVKIGGAETAALEFTYRKED